MKLYNACGDSGLRPEGVPLLRAQVVNDLGTKYVDPVEISKC